MNKKAYSILFSALLASTFVHEIRAKTASKPSFAYQEVIERAAEPNQTCELECHYNSTTNGTTGLTIIATVNLFVAFNQTANVAIIVDIQSNIVVLLNGNTGAAVVIDLSTNKGVYKSEGVWVAAKISIQAYVATLTNLKGLLNISGAVSFTVSTASSTILKAVNDILQFLQVDIGIELKANAKAGLTIVIRLAISIVALLTGDALNLYKLVGTKGVVTLLGIVQLVAFIQGLSIVFKALGGISAIIAAGISLNLEVLAKAQTGLEVLISILLQVGLKINVGQTLGPILNNTGAFFNLTALFGGDSYVGVNGVIKVVATIIAFIDGHVSLDVVISALISFAANRGSATDLSDILNGLLTVLLDALVAIKATASLSGLIIVVRAILNGSFMYKGVNISLIIKILVSAVVGILLNLVVFILVELRAIVAISISIPRLLLILILYLNTAIGISLLRALGIAVSVSVGVSGGILASILGSIGNIVRLLAGGIFNFLLNLAGIGTVVKSLETSVANATQGNSTLSALVSASVSFQGLIKALIQVVIGINVGATSRDLISVRALIQVYTGVNIVIGTNVTVDLR